MRSTASQRQKINCLEDGTPVGSWEEKLSVDAASGTASGEAVFSVEPGTYEVTVKAAGYAEYRQEIKVGTSQRARIHVSTERAADAKLTSGWVRLGDVDNNGKLSGEDADAVMNALLGKEKKEGYVYDLNQDGLDIADLQIAVQNSKKAEQFSPVEKPWPP